MALASLNDVKDFLGIPLAETKYDANLTLFLNSVEAAVIAYCDSDFTEKTVTGEILDGTEADVITTKNTPITSVQAVVLGCEPNGTGGYTLTAGVDYYNDENSIILVNQKTQFRRGSVKVAYKWGYTAIPGDVHLTVLQCVKAEYARFKNNSEHVGSRSKGDESENLGTGSNGGWDAATGLPKQMLAKLQRFKNYEFPNISMAQRNS